MGTCGCHWARDRREAPAAKFAAGGRMPLARHTLREGGCRGAGRAYAVPHCSLTAALPVMGGGGAVGRNAKCTCDTRLLLPSVRKALRTLNRGKICTPCMIRGVRAARRAPSWQDIHVVYPPTAICRAFRMHGAHILPKPAHFEYTTAIYCHEGALFPSEAFFGIHRGKILPSSDTRERITSTYRHRQALGNAFRGHLAVAERPRAHCEHTLLCAGLRGIQFAAYAAMPDRPMTHRGSISPAKPPFGYARGSMLVPTVPRPSPSAGCGGAQLRRWAPPR